MAVIAVAAVTTAAKITMPGGNPGHSCVKRTVPARNGRNFVFLCRGDSPEAPVQAEAKQRNDENTVNTIEIGRARTPEDGRPYGIIR